MDFSIVGDVTYAEAIAVGRSIKELRRRTRAYGVGRWRKMKGTATVRLRNGSHRTAEVHWYEANGIGQREHKLKLPFLD